MFLISSHSSSVVCVSLLLLCPSVVCSQLSCSSFCLLLSPSVVFLIFCLRYSFSCLLRLLLPSQQIVYRSSKSRSHHTSLVESKLYKALLSPPNVTLVNSSLKFIKQFTLSPNRRSLRYLPTPYTFIIVIFQIMKHLMLRLSITISIYHHKHKGLTQSQSQLPQ